MVVVVAGGIWIVRVAAKRNDVLHRTFPKRRSEDVD
jgi:hypothetical protein